MPFSDEELSAIEREHPDGLSSERIVQLFVERGARFSESSLRKYVQLGLLPRSRRVGVKGKSRGSQGLYPATVVRRIQRLKALMETHTIEEILRDFLFVRNDVEELEQSLERIFSAFGQATRAQGNSPETPLALARELAEARTLAAELVAKIIGIETRLSMKARLEHKAG